MSALDRPWGQPGASWDPGPPPRNHLPWAILVTLLCCLPLGGAGVYLSLQVKPLWASGQYVAAAEAATRTKRWAWIAVGVGLVVDLIVGSTILALRGGQAQ